VFCDYADLHLKVNFPNSLSSQKQRIKAGWQGGRVAGWQGGRVVEYAHALLTILAVKERV
jgi:hypothetical protein